MSAREEQEEELESLLAIYDHELEILTEDRTNFNIAIESEESPNPDDVNALSKIILNITYTPDYPEEAPEWKLIDPVDVADDILDGCKEVLAETIEENMGMSMVFALVNAIKEHLDDANVERRKAIEARREAEKEEEQRLEMERLTAGTLLTPETFHEWNEAFIAEQRAIKAEEIARKLAASKDGKKMTGKELFMKYAQEQSAAGDEDEEGTSAAAAGEGEDVAINQDMFAGLDDLDDLDDLDLEAMADEA
eukprot:TRINITY_DN7612_c0_g1_i3.p1 TRINITY_DN7612_c0_g1~~TRINITY_DN7612_c0_g1_i3.p1  ORF type:complete len:251 (+),score=77.99 TRINITY_DN7612_c0_g1_i3:69-821(+)